MNQLVFFQKCSRLYFFTRWLHNSQSKNPIGFRKTHTTQRLQATTYFLETRLVDPAIDINRSECVMFLVSTHEMISHVRH